MGGRRCCTDLARGDRNGEEGGEEGEEEDDVEDTQWVADPEAAREAGAGAARADDGKSGGEEGEGPDGRGAADGDAGVREVGGADRDDDADGPHRRIKEVGRGVERAVRIRDGSDKAGAVANGRLGFYFIAQLAAVLAARAQVAAAIWYRFQDHIRPIRICGIGKIGIETKIMDLPA